MKLDIVAGSKNDEYYTAPCAILPILKYLTPYRKIWCPFDLSESFYVKMLKADGHEVVNTHILNGQNFFDLDIKCDAIVSNPPYSCKGEVFERLFKLGVPFAMLVGVVGIFESQKRFEMFRANKFEIMYFNRRVKFLKSYEDEKPTTNPPFSSVYVCHNILPKQIVFEELGGIK